jgi:hypothetical protein
VDNAVNKQHLKDMIQLKVQEDFEGWSTGRLILPALRLRPQLWIPGEECAEGCVVCALPARNIYFTKVTSCMTVTAAMYYGGKVALEGTAIDKPPRSIETPAFMQEHFGSLQRCRRTKGAGMCAKGHHDPCGTLALDSGWFVPVLES